MSFRRVGFVLVLLLVLLCDMLRALTRTSSMKRPFASLSPTFSSSTLRLKSSASSTVSYGGPPQALISVAVKAALLRAFGPEVGESAEALVFATKPEFGDYQSNAAMPLAKKLGQKPQDIAKRIVEALGEGQSQSQATELIDLSAVTVTGPGFINMRLADVALTTKVASMLGDSSGRLGISSEPYPHKQKVIVDYSSPNIAKEMHVGHLRSTIIGDCLSKLLSFLGHDVSRLNHVGDWGTQFGMLITYLQLEANRGSSRDSISDLVEFYRSAKKRFDEDPAFQEQSRAAVVKLQGGDADTLDAWRSICDLSRREFSKIYDMLDVSGLEERGESFYNPLLPSLVAELEAGGHATESEGALCIFVDGYSNTDGTPLPLIVRKSDGGYLYATTDLAAVRQRSRDMGADRVLYVTDVGQSQHFSMVFAAAKRAGLVAPSTELRHVPFGLVQGEDGKKFKTRAGDTVKLKDLLDEAVRAAGEVLRQGGTGSIGAAPQTNEADANTATATATVTELTAEQQQAARVIGIGAVKYADLSMNRESNYRFSFKKMLALQGNTAPYMLYAFARIQGIRRKALQALGGESGAQGEGQGGLPSLTAADLLLPTPEERLLAVQLLRFEETLLEVERDLCPNRLCDYLFDTSQRFNQFYERCPVIKAETPALVRSRSALCAVTADVLKLGLDLLGIQTLERL